MIFKKKMKLICARLLHVDLLESKYNMFVFVYVSNNSSLMFVKRRCKRNEVFESFINMRIIRHYRVSFSCRTLALAYSIFWLVLSFFLWCTIIMCHFQVFLNKICYEDLFSWYILGARLEYAASRDICLRTYDTTNHDLAIIEIFRQHDKWLTSRASPRLDDSVLSTATIRNHF